MEFFDYKELINSIRCNPPSDLEFTEDDLAKVKACLDKVNPIETIDYESALNFQMESTSCIPNAIQDLQKILEDQQGSMIEGIKQGIIRAKVQEIVDNLDIVDFYYTVRLAHLTELVNLIKDNTEEAKEKLESIIQTTQSLPSDLMEATVFLQSFFSKISNQLVVEFPENSKTIPKHSSVLRLRLIGYDGVSMKFPDPTTGQLEETIVKIKDNPILDPFMFSVKRNSFSIFNETAYDPSSSSNPPKIESDYDSIPGLLYNGTPTSTYLGLYKKLAKPITYLFSLEERGLSIDKNLIDPILKKIQDAPTSIKEDGVTYYISNQKAYETFYESLKEEYPKRVKKEREVSYGSAIAPVLSELEALAKMEATDIIRRSISPIGAFPSSIGNKTMSKSYVYCRSSKNEVDDLLLVCNAQVKKLDTLIQENVMNEDSIKKKVSDLECFSKAMSTQPEPGGDCEEEVMKKLGNDPLYLRTIYQTNSGLPDIGTQCYWREFAKALNRICLLPYPDLSGPPPANTIFRYWPVNCIIPVGIALVLVTVPPVWKPLFVLPTPLGTLVCFLTMPIAPIGIPLPSVYLYYFAPDGSKYLALAVNFPILYTTAKNLLFGFELDNSESSRNPLGLNPTNPYKGFPIKGAFTQPIKFSAVSSRATRLAKLTADLALGKQPTVMNLNGSELPLSISMEDFGKSYVSEEERMKDILDAKPAKEFDRQSALLKRTINKQLDKLGEMRTQEVDSLRQKVRETRNLELEKAESEKDNATRRLAKRAARGINPLTVQNKIDSVTSSVMEHIDNIKFGTIRFPKDTTKYNPGWPEAITSLFDLIEMGSLGDLKIDDRAKSLNFQIKKTLSKVNVDGLSSKKSFDLDDPLDFADLKSFLSRMTEETVKYLSGETVGFDVSDAKDDDEATRILEANRNVQETIRNSLAFTAFALANPPKITIFDLSKKCCEVQSKPLFSGLPPDLSIAFSVLTALMQAIIDGLTVADVKDLIGTNTKTISKSFVVTLFDSLVSSIPKVSLPEPINLMLLLQVILVPILSLISIPKAINPLQVPMIPIVIPLDPILKPLLKALLSSLIYGAFKLLEEAKSIEESTGFFTIGSNGQIINPTVGNNQIQVSTEMDASMMKTVLSIACDNETTVSLTVEQILSLEYDGLDGKLSQTSNQRTVSVSVDLPDGTRSVLPSLPFFALDVIGYFHLITSADIIEFVRHLINSLIDSILDPVRMIVNTISSIAMSMNSFSFNVIEAAIPLISILKLAKIAIDSKIPPSLKVQTISPTIQNLIQFSVVPALEAVEPVIKEIAWIGTTALCALSSPVNLYSTVSLARLVHPIMNQDDLPPWERLTHKNPLFAIFLDELAWRGSIYSTGSLIFQTKTPAALPYSPIFPIVHVSPHLT